MTNKDLDYGKIDKDPSRVIFADIMSIDKARLGRKIGALSNRLDLLIKKHLDL